MKFKETQIGSRLSNQPGGILGRYCTFVGINEGDLANTRPFFDIYNKEGNKLVGNSAGDNVLEKIFKGETYKIFPKAVEYRPFRDAELISMIQGLVRDGPEDVDFRYTARGDHFAFSSPSDSEQAADNIRIAHDKYSYFLKLLKKVSLIIRKHGDRLKQWNGFQDVENIANNIEVLELVFHHLLMVPDGSDTIKTSGLSSEELGITVRLDPQIAAETGVSGEAVKTHCHLPGNAAAEFLQVRGMQHYVQEILMVAQLIEYVEKVREIDAPYFGVQPKVQQADGKGLRFSFRKFHHAYLLREGQGGTPGIDISAAMYKDLGATEALIDHLIAHGLVGEIVRRENDYRRGRADKLRWAEAVTRQELEAALDDFPETRDAMSELRLKLIAHFSNSVSETFGDFSLGEEDPESGQQITVVVLPSPNMAGKSTSLKALGLLLHAALMGRTIAAESAEMTVPDQIFHNFNVEDDLTHQRSTFKAQLENIKDFLDSATMNSLGLFDELFNGTSSDYQLALAWAFLEKCSHQNLRVMISTHNRDLEYYSDPNGYERIRASHGRPADAILSTGARSAKTVSIGHDHKFKYGSERDSEALIIAREVLSPDYDDLLERAEEVLAHVRRPRE